MDPLTSDGAKAERQALLSEALLCIMKLTDEQLLAVLDKMRAERNRSA